jgi:hypothetical protein
MEQKIRVFFKIYIQEFHLRTCVRTHQEIWVRRGGGGEWRSIVATEDDLAYPSM